MEQQDQQMQQIGGQPGPFVRAPELPLTHWSTGLFYCREPGQCNTFVDACFCGWCLYGYQVSLFQHHWQGPWAKMHPESCVLAITFDIVCGGLGLPLLHISVRESARARYGIAPSCECPTAFFCAPCSAAQLTREATIQLQWPGSTCTAGVPLESRHVFNIQKPITQQGLALSVQPAEGTVV